ncbi:MAG: helix-turn-helix domain-containing protein [bacterium]|nr:helix-turn-helix domain-containing protein [bacterium]
MSRRALSATRAADLLNFLAAHPDEPLSYSELSSRLGINPASTHNLLMALTECGYLSRDPKTRTFSLGAALVAIGDAALRENPIVDEARVEMGKLAKTLDMGAVALVRAGSDALCIARAGPRRARIDPPEVGQRIPIMAPLVSVFAAWGSEEAVDQWLQRGSPAPADQARARESLERVRARGYSVALEVPSRRRLGGLIADLAEQPHSERLRERLHETIGELGRSSFQLSESDGQPHSISTITAPVFDRHGEVCVAISLQVFARALDADGIAAVGGPLVETTRALSHGEP